MEDTGLSIPDSFFGEGLYDFGWGEATGQPPAQAAGTASQIESGGSGFNWNSALSDITKAWMTVEALDSPRPEALTGYRTNAQGQLYATNPQGAATLGGVGSAIGGIPTAWLLIGALIFAVVTMSKD